MSLTKKTTHASEALARLLEQLKTVAGHASVLNALNAQTQAVEDALWQLLNDRWLSTAVGAQLDVLGRILREPRDGSLDAPYVERLKAKIRVLRSSGAAPDIIRIFKLMLPNNTIFFRTIGAGDFLLDIGAVTVSNLPTYQRFVRDARSAGIGGQLFYHDGGSFADAFTLSPTDSTTAGDTAKGFRPEPADGTGGKLSDVIL